MKKSPIGLFINNPRPRPRRRLPTKKPIVEVAVDPKANFINDIRIVHEHPINRSVDGRRADGDGRRVRGVGGKGDVRSAPAGNPLPYRVDVDGVGAGKEGRERDLRVGRRVGVVNVAGALPTIGGAVRSGGSAQSGARGDGGAAAKNPDAVGGGILAGIDVDDQLRLTLL